MTKSKQLSIFTDKKPCGIIEAKREEEGERLKVHEDQSPGYAKSELKYLDNAPLPFVYESTGVITIGARDDDLFLSLANRLIRLEKQITDDEKKKIGELSGGKNIHTIVKDLLGAYDPDIIELKQNEIKKHIPYEHITLEKIEACKAKAMEELALIASSNFNGEMNEYIENVRKIHEQIIDTINIDTLTKSEWDSFTGKKARKIIRDFKTYIEENKVEIIALSIFYDQPYRRKELTFKMVKDLLETIKLNKPLLAPYYVWDAYSRIEQVKERNPKNEMIALVSLIRRVVEIDKELTPYNYFVDKNFQEWVFKKHSGASAKFTEE